MQTESWWTETDGKEWGWGREGGRVRWENQEKYDMTVGEADREKRWDSREVERQAAMWWPCSEPAVWSLILTPTHGPTVNCYFCASYTLPPPPQHNNVNKQNILFMLCCEFFTFKDIYVQRPYLISKVQVTVQLQVSTSVLSPSLLCFYHGYRCRSH